MKFQLIALTTLVTTVVVQSQVAGDCTGKKDGDACVKDVNNKQSVIRSVFQC